MSVAYVDSSRIIAVALKEPGSDAVSASLREHRRLVASNLLEAEVRTILETGYLRGADLWHLATALFIAPQHDIDFLTLDTRQRGVAARLGFKTPVGT